MSLAIFDETYPQYQGTTVTDANGVAQFNIMTSQGGPYRIDNVFAANTDTIDHVIQLFYNDLGTSVLLGSVNIPAGQGTGGTPALDVLLGVLGPLSTGLVFVQDDALNGQLEVAVVPTFTVTINAVGGRL